MNDSFPSRLMGGVCSSALLFLAGCHAWRYDATVQGLAFRQVRIEENGLVIGQLKEDTIIRGRPCKRGWVHLQADGVPVGFTAFRAINLGRFQIPADTWVFQSADGTVQVCAFPKDTEIQGHCCRGSGGPKGVQTAFYSSGALKQFFLCRDTTVDGIPCQAGSLNESVALHENGRLKACALGEAIVRDGRRCGCGGRPTSSA